MGLDIYFQMDKALNAGLETRIAVSDCRDVGAKTQTVELVASIPGTDYDVALDHVTWEGVVMGSIRANKWGTTYEPFTKWLKQNNIEWKELS